MTNLYLFTDNFPYGKGEAFIEDELAILSTQFDQVYICPLHKAAGERLLPANAAVINLFEQEIYNGRKIWWNNKWLHFSLLFQEFVHVKYKWNFIKNVREHSSILLHSIFKSAILYKNIDKTRINVFHSFWFYEWATILSVLKKANKIDCFFSRAHSFDIYGEYFRKDKIIPFRYFQLKQVHSVFPDSMEGVLAMKAQTTMYKEKVKIGYLGGMDYGLNPYVNDNVVKIISCAFVIPRKRVGMIIEALKLVNVKVKWTHIGDGPGLQDIKDNAALLPSNIRCEFEGYMEKEAMLDQYKKNAFDFMLHVSEKEGLPAVLIDAASFGIPVIATDAGGVKELVNEQTGLLLPIDVSANEIAAIICNFKKSTLNSMDFRKQVKNSWNAKFNAVNNYMKMAELFLNKK